PAGSLPDPMLTAGVMDLVLPHFEFNQSDFTEVDVELSQEIPWPGSLGARSEVMRATTAGARAEEGTARRDLRTTMAVAYYRLGYAVTALETLHHQRELLEAAVQLSTTRYATGAAPQSDPLQAKLGRARRFNWGRGWAARRGAPAQPRGDRSRCPSPGVTTAPGAPRGRRAAQCAGNRRIGAAELSGRSRRIPDAAVGRRRPVPSRAG